MSMYDDDDFDELMADVEIGNFDGFMLSEEEVEAGKKERKAQIERDVKELRELMDAAEAAQKEGKGVDNKTIRRIKQLSSDKYVLTAAMDDTYTIDELVDIENGDYKGKEDEEEKSERMSTADLAEAIREALKEEDPFKALRKSGVKVAGIEDDDEEEAEEEPKPVKSSKKTSSKKAASKSTKTSGGKKVTTKGIVYYTYDDGKIWAVKKTFWDKNGYVDDRSGTPLAKAFESVGVIEESESFFNTELSEEEVVEKMAGVGYHLVKDPDFSNFIESTN